jgi:hypothetical protein
MDPKMSSRIVASTVVPRTIVLEYSSVRKLYITSAVIEMAIMLLVMIRAKSVEKPVILLRLIFPLINETIIHIMARPRKKGVWEGRYDLMLAGFVQTMARKDIVRMITSARRVMVLNLRFSIGNPTIRLGFKKLSN